MWVGNSRSVTALHKDNYENVYVQVAGRKHFVLLPPLCHPCVNEQLLRPAHYRRRRRSRKRNCSPSAASAAAASAATTSPSDPEKEETASQQEAADTDAESDDDDNATLELELELEPETDDPVPFATWDPDRPRDNTTPYSHLADPMRVTLEPGDMLYLPCMWCVFFFSFPSPLFSQE